MKITLYMAVSADGLITKGENDSDWVSPNDWDQFYKYIQSNDAIIMGRKTMDQFGEDEFPIEEVVNIVLSRNEDLHINSDNLIILEGSPKDVVKLADKKGLKNLLLIGGEDVNNQFIKNKLIDEIVLSVHPLLIGNGLSLCGIENLKVKLKLKTSKVVNDELVQIEYKVLK